jgi:hypothetical protein
MENEVGLARVAELFGLAGRTAIVTGVTLSVDGGFHIS